MVNKKRTVKRVRKLNTKKAASKKKVEKNTEELKEGDVGVGPVRSTIKLKSSPNTPVATYSDSPNAKVGRDEKEESAKEVLAIVKYYREQIKTKNAIIKTLEEELISVRNRNSILKENVDNFEGTLDDHLATQAEEKILGDHDFVKSLTSLFSYPKGA